MDDTIAAIATPLGVGGIAVVRISGPRAESIGKSIFHPSHSRETEFDSHRLYHGHIVSPENGTVIDEVMVVLMRGPRSYTGEDVLEIHGHGGYLLPQKVLDESLKAGARPAEAGEFTKRAFLNNRMDLSQAEAVADMITAQTNRGLEIAQSQYHRQLTDKIMDIHEAIAAILTQIEAAIDFCADDPDICEDMTIPNRLLEIGNNVNSLIAGYGKGKIYRQGISMVITGRTNVGKSSLLNRLLGEKRAIVAAGPGTTRDFIEETINIRDVPVRLTDTAGIRATEDAVEQEGIDMVWQRVKAADAVLLVLDGSEALTEEDRRLMTRLGKKPLIPVVNKADLPCLLKEEVLSPIFPDKRAVRISAKYGSGMDELEDAICRHFLPSADTTSNHQGLITNLRHKLALEKASFFICEATGRAARGTAPELTASDLRDALESLEEITGRTFNDDILARIFSNFCVGK